MTDAEVLSTYRQVGSWTKTGKIHYLSRWQAKQAVRRAARNESK